MAEMPQEIVDLINSVPLCYLATATRSGIPDVAPVATSVARDATTILVSVTAQGKSAANIRENPRAALVVHSTPPSGAQASLASITQVKGAQIKGKAVVVTSGDNHELARNRAAEALGPEARDTFAATIVLQVEEIYSLVPQPGRQSRTG
jgi:predicted pyridoxine 5'-phosphate oxidase superfamily flavin-nucleotide-binding protein